MEDFLALVWSWQEKELPGWLSGYWTSQDLLRAILSQGWELPPEWTRDGPKISAVSLGRYLTGLEKTGRVESQQKRHHNRKLWHVPEPLL